MVQGYYTLQEAAHVLGISPDELKQIAQRKQVRSFQDRGTLRFRIQDIQELARQRGGSSDPDLVLGEAGPATPKSGARSDVSPRTPQKQQPASGASPRPGPRTPQDSPEVFAFSLEGGDEKVDIGAEHKSDPRRKGPKSPSPVPKPGSDSDVKLVAEHVSSDPGSDSDVKLVGPESDLASRTPKVQKKSGLGPVSPVPKKMGGPPDSAPPKRPSRLGAPGQPDSGVRLVPMDSDSDVKIVSGSGEDINLGQGAPPAATDSDIRLEKYQQPSGGEERGQLTEEINLDEEIKKKEAAIQNQPQVKVKPKSKVKLPQPTSPFELSESDIDQPAKGQGRPDSSDFEVTPKKKDDSSDFDLTPQKEPSSVLEPEDSDFSLELPEDSALGGEAAPLKGPSSGINLSKPVDSGISLEDSGEDSSVDFDLSLEVESTPKPAKSKKEPVSDSDFELSLEETGKKGAPADSDSSEFELTLDDSSANLELEQIKAGSEEKDIFETDFDPGLEEESGSQVAALETDLESSDFDISLDDSSVEESGSQVVALDEEADEAAATIATDAPEIEVELDEEGAVAAAPGQVRIKEVVREKLIEPAPWGAMPVVFMLPCVIVMLLVGLLGFELAQSAAGFKSAGFLTRTIGEMIGQKIR
ncbi:MAG: hypothetical protein L0Y72_14380 [Gemmataceae bacterium]|nr:hypothetical protein [Gemmataceae bacterium]MCI0740230.1 hypothetical protein [Gemmataceae bacterium]